MTIEQLEWLDLSSPTNPAPDRPVEAGAAPCPTCGWPVAIDREVCANCGHTLTRQFSADLLAELDINLPPRKIEISPAPDRWFDGSGLDTVAFYQLRLQAEQFHVSTGFDHLICLDDISVDNYQHQLEAALRALRDMRGRALLADEVGLGKTIEAGIVMKELIERGLVNSILVLTPASLTRQWQEEMETKFHESFEVLEHFKQLPGQADKSNEPCRWIISLDRAKSSRWDECLLAREYDLLIVDEAHKLKNHRTRAYRFVNQIRKQYVLMLTATPVHNNLMELYNLVTILRPGHLGTRKAFRDNFVLNISSGSRRRVLSWRIKKAEGVASYINSAANVRNPDYSFGSHGYNITKIAGDAFALDQLPELPTASESDTPDVDKLDRLKFEQMMTQFNELRQQGYLVTRVWQVTYKGSFWAFRNTSLDGKLCGLRIEFVGAGAEDDASEVKPRKATRRTTTRNPQALRELLREIMIRNRRNKVGVRFPPRKAAVYNLNLSPSERDLYDSVTGYIREQLQQGAQQKGARGSLRMTLMALQKQLCSSPQAVARSLENLNKRQPNPQLNDYLTLASDIEEGRKVLAALTILEQYPAKTLIFTDYLPTLHTLHRSLAQAGYETVIFHGGMSSLERAEAVRQFRHSAQVMISTQSGSEGHNLQFCHQLINYDLPWNPMRIEQRVGRLHRLGQKETVSIFNLSANDTIEAYILDLLAHKIRMFELVIGELDLILGELGDQHGFEHYIEEAWVGSQSEAELLRMIAELEALLDKSQDTYKEVRSASDELSDLLDAFDEVYN